LNLYPEIKTRLEIRNGKIKVLTGQKGHGKTTLIQKIVLDWHNEKEIIIYLENDTDLKKAVFDYVNVSTMVEFKNFLEEYSTKYQKSVKLVVDSFKVDANNSAFLSQLHYELAENFIHIILSSSINGHFESIKQISGMSDRAREIILPNYSNNEVTSIKDRIRQSIQGGLSEDNTNNVFTEMGGNLREIESVLKESHTNDEIAEKLNQNKQQLSASLRKIWKHDNYKELSRKFLVIINTTANHQLPPEVRQLVEELIMKNFIRQTTEGYDWYGSDISMIVTEH